jgi:hypothetical protein
MGVRASLRLPRLISRALKLMIMQASSDHHISNHKVRTWDHKGSQTFGPKLLLLSQLLDDYYYETLIKIVFGIIFFSYFKNLMMRTSWSRGHATHTQKH